VEPGTLEFASLSEFEGARYSLEATLDVSGPSSFVVETGPSRRLIGRSLGPGTYRLVIWPHPQVFVDEIVAQVPVNCELASDQTRPFEISSGAATRLAFEFAMPSGRLSFQPE
jgi:hypothetical protein